ncbi:hypothetical protein [Paenibacillus polymyxa]|uniref:hypothetical protein n=1 Tax=Paenibacillus polymyxa TaxID=1406 RepID=UPI001269E73F|nr:hypothetical protein [Paenibacillus polymyxa]
MTKIPISQLINILQAQELVEVNDIEALFDPTNYLVSPFNSPDEFMAGQYFLTNHQDVIKSNILNLRPATGPTFILKLVQFPIIFCLYQGFMSMGISVLLTGRLDGTSLSTSKALHRISTIN